MFLSEELLYDTGVNQGSYMKRRRVEVVFTHFAALNRVRSIQNQFSEDMLMLVVRMTRRSFLLGQRCSAFECGVN